jgi:hypothetical protein
VFVRTGYHTQVPEISEQIDDSRNETTLLDIEFCSNQSDSNCLSRHKRECQRYSPVYTCLRMHKHVYILAYGI